MVLLPFIAPGGALKPHYRSIDVPELLEHAVGRCIDVIIDHLGAPGGAKQDLLDVDPMMLTKVRTLPRASEDEVKESLTRQLGRIPDPCQVQSS